MTTLVTGGAGFIGSHLTESLLSSGEDVIIIDDLSTGSERNLGTLLEHPSVRFVKGSILDVPLLDELVSQVDSIYHLAAAVGTFTILDKTLESLRTNLHGTENVLDSAVRHGARVLVASTSEVYGKNTKIGLREDDDRIAGSPLKNRWSYAGAKALDETFAYLYWMEHGLETVMVRLFNTVGPRQTGRYGMVIPRFVAQALAGEPLTVYGTGNQVRCFCHVLDVVPALRTLMADERAHGQVFNLGSSDQVSITGLAERVISVLGSSSTITYVPYESAYGAGFEDMERRVPDCTKARQFIGFSPSRSLVDIIEAVAEDQLTSSGEVSVMSGGEGAGDPDSVLRSRARVLPAEPAGPSATIRWDAGVASRLGP
jgi:UDP-glucose 4-epimerase